MKAQAIYRYQADERNPGWVRVSAEIAATGDRTELVFPAWRPGRYELAHFVKKTRGLQFFTGERKATVHTIDLNRWELDTKNCEQIKVTYQFYARDWNAGATCFGPDLLLINPVNLTIYCPDHLNAPCEIHLDLPPNWKMASAVGHTLHETSHTMASLHRWMDTPVLAAPTLQKLTVTVKNYVFHLHFVGEVRPDKDRLIRDFSAFARKQIEAFGSLPVPEYHFLFMIRTTDFYHGVEHLDSTVIALGPGCELMESKYDELLGISSHELYHSWNIKTIRPASLMPYDYSRPANMEMGYLAEGITTYMGDFYLLKSGVWTDERFGLELTRMLQRHQDNFGRWNMSVAESGRQLWHDGYEAGIPGRKVSIYNEGGLLALCLDVIIREYSDNHHSLENLMHGLYTDPEVCANGITPEQFRGTMEKWGGEKADALYRECYTGTREYRAYLDDALEYLGWEIVVEPGERFAEDRLGIQFAADGKTVARVYPGSIAEEFGFLPGDQWLMINGNPVDGYLDSWLRYFHREKIEVRVQRDGRGHVFPVQTSDHQYFKRYTVRKKEHPSVRSRQNWNIFSGRKKKK